MKKKIVYISGADGFNLDDVRAAFDEVRNTLKLDSDTILFGVPVDSDESVGDADVAVQSTECAAEPPLEVDDTPDPEIESDRIEVDAESTVDVENVDDVVVPDVEEVKTPVDEQESEAPVVPILSVLAAKEEDAVEPVDNNDAEEQVVAVEEAVESDSENPIELDEDESDITDMINDDMPVEVTEKTLEELLETMAPLREDATDTAAGQKPSVEPTIEVSDEIDATLENLATEFAENQDKMVDSKKSAERGKIGKLKNILPFKKTKREDPGLMGDLFGWAGIAANDEDFTIPGFFKQKM